MSYNTFRGVVLITGARRFHVRQSETGAGLVTRHGVGPSRVDATDTGDFDDRGIIISGVFN